VTKIDINADQTLTVTWAGEKGGGSLLHIASVSNAKYVNALDAIELWTVLFSVKTVPFPLGGSLGAFRYVDIYQRVRSWVDEKGLDNLIGEESHSMSLGQLRRYVIVKAGEGFNAPTDSYLRAAYELKQRQTESEHAHR
jgi:hypothetical protein